MWFLSQNLYSFTDKNSYNYFKMINIDFKKMNKTVNFPIKYGTFLRTNDELFPIKYSISKVLDTSKSF